MFESSLKLIEGMPEDELSPDECGELVCQERSEWCVECEAAEKKEEKRMC